MHEYSSQESNSDLEKNIHPSNLQDLHQQHLNLKLEVEQLYRKVELMRGLFQTLVSGLIIALVIAIGISSWFAYRLLLQAQISRQEAEKAAAAQAEMLKQVEQLSDKFQRVNDQFPEKLDKFTEKTQEQLQELRDRIRKTEESREQLTNPNSNK